MKFSKKYSPYYIALLLSALIFFTEVLHADTDSRIATQQIQCSSSNAQHNVGIHCE